MTVSFGAAGTGTTAASSINLAYPASLVAGHYITAVIFSGDPLVPPDIPVESSAFTLLGTAANTDSTLATADAGPRRCSVFGKIADGTESGTVTFSITAGTGSLIVGIMYRWTKTLATWDVAAYTDNYQNTEGTFTTLLFPSVDMAVDDMLVINTADPDDTQALSGQAFAATGFTFGAITEMLDSGSTQGNDGRHHVSRGAVATGTGTADLTFTLTQDESMGGVLVRLRDTAGGATVTPAAIAVTAAVPGPTATGGAVVAPAAISATATLPTPTVVAPTIVTPAAIAASTSMPSAAVTTGAVASPAAITAVAALPTPTAQGGATVSPAAVSAVATLPTPTLIVGATATPAAVAATITLPTPTIAVAATVTPAAVSALVTLPPPLATVGAVAAPAAIPILVTLPTPTLDTGPLPGIDIDDNAYPARQRHQANPTGPRPRHDAYPWRRVSLVRDLPSTTSEQIAYVVETSADPAAALPEFAITVSGAEPTTWVAGAWTGGPWSPTTGKIRALSPLVGEGDPLDINPGVTYSIWIRWTVGTETPVRLVDEFRTT